MKKIKKPAPLDVKILDNGLKQYGAMKNKNSPKAPTCGAPCCSCPPQTNGKTISCTACKTPCGTGCRATCAPFCGTLCGAIYCGTPCKTSPGNSTDKTEKKSSGDGSEPCSCKSYLESKKPAPRMLRLT